MITEEFIEEIKKNRDRTFNAMIKKLSKPAGRSPRKSLLELSSFYNSFPDKEMIHKIILEAIDFAIFDVFCILDHVSFIENTEEKTEFELYAVKGGERIRINDPDKEELHNLYNSLVLPED